MPIISCSILQPVIEGPLHVHVLVDPEHVQPAVHESCRESNRCQVEDGPTIHHRGAHIQLKRLSCLFICLAREAFAILHPKKPFHILK